MAATKRSTSKNGNAVIIALVAAGLAFASIFTEWGTANISTEEISRNSNSVIEELGGLLIAGLAGGRMIITGESSFKFLGMMIPMWIISAIVIAGAGIAAANLSKYAALPRLVPQILCGIGAAMAIYFMVSLLDGGLGIGIILLLAGAGLGLFASLKKA